MSNEILIRFCAPTIARLKTGNMFICAFDSQEQMTGELKHLNRRLGKKVCGSCRSGGAAARRCSTSTGRNCWSGISKTRWPGRSSPNAATPPETPLPAWPS